MKINLGLLLLNSLEKKPIKVLFTQKNKFFSKEKVNNKEIQDQISCEILWLLYNTKVIYENFNNYTYFINIIEL